MTAAIGADPLDERAYVGRAFICVGDELVVADLAIERALALRDPAARVERVSAAEDKGAGVLNALTTPSLFGPRVVVCSDLDAVDARHFEELAQVLGVTETLFVAWADKLDAKRRKLVSGHAHLLDCSRPTGARLRALITKLAQDFGVTLSGEQTAWLASQMADELPRVRSMLQQLQGASISSPSTRQLHILAGSRAGGCGPAPYELANAIERGDTKAALDWVDESRNDPFATLGYLRARLGKTPTAWPALMKAENDLRSDRDRQVTVDELVVSLCSALGAASLRRKPR